MGMRIGVLTLQDDVSPAQWVTDRIQTFGESVASLVPTGFEAYARIFHPALSLIPGEERSVPWAEIATAGGRKAHAEMQLPNLTGQWPHRDQQTESSWNHEPDEGSLPRDIAVMLGMLLAPFTTTPDRCWFCVWDGFGGSKLPHQNPHKVELPHRLYHLLQGPIEGIKESFLEPWGSNAIWQSANLWWPDDRVWFIATEIDLMSTYVGGTRACIDALLGDPDLEVMEAQPTHGIGYHSDRINPPPREPYW